MSGVFHPASEATRARIKALAERELSAEEFVVAASIPISPEERTATLDLVVWFSRRYPTPAARLAYVRRAHRRWTRGVLLQPES